jgi:hypothetical protein
MADMATKKQIRSIDDFPAWMRELQGFELFAFQPEEGDGWSMWPKDVSSEEPDFPGGTWEIRMKLPKDLSLMDGYVDPLLALALISAGMGKLEDKVGDIVEYCRAHGKSWTQIGQSLGMSKQAAWERFSGED